MIDCVRRTLAVCLLMTAGLLIAGPGRADDGFTPVKFFSAGERADHCASFVQATLDAKAWFDTFARQPAK